MESFVELTDHLRRHAGRYFADVCGERAQVALRRTSRRTNSTLQEFIVGDGAHEHTVLVKTPSGPRPVTQRGLGSDRPRLFPKVQPELKSRFEYRALSAIERHVTGLDDPRFAAVRVLELLPEKQALVMEKVSEQSLTAMLLRPPLLRGRDSAALCDRIVKNSGCWLRRYHGLPGLEHTQSRGASRAEFTDSVERFTEYLGETSGGAYFGRLGRELVDLAEAVLPPTLPLGLGHGDYAPRNVLAAPSGRIRVIDTQARWRAPIYEDISHFLTAVKASAPQVCSWGLAYRPATVAQLEHQFLSGYFGRRRVPLERIRLFECQALVERWAAFVYRRQESRGWKKIVKGGRALWWSGFLKSTIDHLLAEARAAADLAPDHPVPHLRKVAQ